MPPTPVRLLATPDPAERVSVGPITEVNSFAVEDNLSYVATELQPTLAEPRQLYGILIRDKATNKVTQLGDAQGVAMIEGQSPQYLFWHYQCNQCDGPVTFENGLHAYNLALGHNTYLGEGKQAEADSDWVIYRTLPDDTGFYHLQAANLQTGETLLLSESLPYEPGRNPSSFYALNEGIVGWIETDTTTLAKTIKVFDLEKHAAKPLEIKTTQPIDIAVSKQLVIWRDSFWKGYDLQQTNVFTPPWVPVGFGLEQGNGFIYLSAAGDNVRWQYVSENGSRFFTAPIVRK